MPMPSDDIQRDDWPGCPRGDCYFCRDDCDVLEDHHIVPDRHGGSDADRNLVTLCPTCHEKLERLYDKRFYESLGVGEPEEVVRHLSEYIVCELERIDVALSRALKETRTRIGKTHLDGDGMPDDLRDSIDEAISEYQAEKIEDHDGAGEGGKKDRIKLIRSIIRQNEGEKGAPEEAVYNAAKNYGMDRSRAEHEIEKLRQKGELFEPTRGYYRVL